jgi:Ala-tRNA(Pro) deacylase
MLDVRGIPYEAVEHSEAHTAQELAHREHVSGRRVARVVVVIADGRPVVLVLPAGRRIDLGEAGRLLGAEEVRLATEGEMAKTFPGAEPGAIPPLPHWPGIPVLMDNSFDSRWRSCPVPGEGATC